MPMRPVIGICGAIESARWGVWDQRAVLTPLDYVRAVQEAGGLVLIVPPDPAFGEVPEQVLAQLDGLQRTVLVSGFSKILAPSMRLGWVVAARFIATSASARPSTAAASGSSPSPRSRLVRRPARARTGVAEM